MFTNKTLQTTGERHHALFNIIIIAAIRHPAHSIVIDHCWEQALDVSWPRHAAL